ncbi:hypothetical protein ACFTQL_03680 [Peribacillus butanolivorans]
MARFERHSSSNIFDFSTQQSFGHVGEMIIDQGIWTLFPRKELWL